MRTRVSVAAMDSLPHSEDSESYTLESVVRGHHVYKTIWTPVIQIPPVQIDLPSKSLAHSVYKSTP